jgi:hypothetical protein
MRQASQLQQCHSETGSMKRTVRQEEEEEEEEVAPAVAVATKA